MRIIAVMSPKGGIGKTTTSDSIAYMLGEEQGKRVLAIMRMDANEYCSRCKGFRRDGKLYLTYMLRIEKINAED